MASPTSDLLALTNIITENVGVIQHAFDEAGLAHPTIHDVYDPQSRREQLTLLPDVINAALLATSAASQLIATLKIPGLAISDKAYGFHISAAIRIAAEACIAEILREAGPEGLHVEKIAARSEVDPSVLARVMRLLASYYVFKEVTPNVFTNNRLSSLLDTGKDSRAILIPEELRKRNQISMKREIADQPMGKHLSTNGITAVIEHFSEEVCKSVAYLPEVVLSNDYSKTPFERAYGFDGTLWESYEKHPGRLQRVQMVMEGFINCRPHNKNFEGFKWSSLHKDALVIDVGGGSGSKAYDVAQIAPQVKLIVQDRKDTINAVTLPIWKADAARRALLDSGRVMLQGQDFFTPQNPVVFGHAAVFILRQIIHDWATPECIAILRQLHAAATRDTKLVIMDQLVPYACPTPAELLLPGAEGPRVPPPLLANLGEARADVYCGDFAMAALIRSQERTAGEWAEMVTEAGWKIERVYQPVGSVFSEIVCGKIE